MSLLSDFEVKLTCSESPVKSWNSSDVYINTTYYYYNYCMERETECLPHDERHQEQTSTVTATYRPVGHPLHPFASALAALTTYHHATPDDRHAYGKDESDRQTETEPRENPPQLKTATITASDIFPTVVGGCGMYSYGFRITGIHCICVHHNAYSLYLRISHIRTRLPTDTDAEHTHTYLDIRSRTRTMARVHTQTRNCTIFIK